MPNNLILIGCVAIEHAARCLSPDDACRKIVEADISALRAGRDPQLRLKESQKNPDRRINRTGQGELLVAGKEVLKLTSRNFGTGKSLAIGPSAWGAVELMNGYQAGQYEINWQEFAIHPMLDRADELSVEDILK